jgi:ligand-binding sensor domain-containing protein
MKTVDEPLTGLSNNTIIAITSHKGAIWMATSQGLIFTKDGGETWNRYDETNGLISEEISSLYSDDVNGRLWTTSNHTVNISGTTVSHADGLTFTDNEGMLWDTIQAPGSYGYQATVFDLTGYDSLLFGASWAGGLFGTFDGGETWQKIYYSKADSLADEADTISYTNLYFSAVIDTLHPDSLVLWGGTANGLMRYVYGPADAAPSSNYIYDLTSGDGFLFIAGDSGLTRLDFGTGAETFHSAFTENGLPGQAVSAVEYFCGRLFAGTLDSLNGDGTGIAVSDDTGLTFQDGIPGLESIVGSKKYALDFASIGSHLFMAAYEAGLYHSADTGRHWEKIYADSSNMTAGNRRNIINTVDADSSRLWLGTDSGLVILYMNTPGIIDSSEYKVFTDTDSTGAVIYKLRIQKFEDNTEMIWTINSPGNVTYGVYSVHRYNPQDDIWDLFPADTPYYDIGFIDSAVYLTGLDIWASSPNGAGFYVNSAVGIRDSLSPTINFYTQKLTSFEAVDDTIYIGSSKGLAISPPGSANWHIYLANTNPRHHDKVSRIMISSGISGNFITAMEIQSLPDGTNLIWATTRPGYTGGGTNGISVAALDGISWDVKAEGMIAWNYAFRDSTVLAATSAGLMRSSDLGETWDTLTITGTLLNYQPQLPYTIDPNVEIYAVAVVNDTVWIGSDDGAAKIAFADLGEPDWGIFRTYDSSAASYAYPVPYSPYTDDTQISFHYAVPKDAYVTIEVYDFAMNLVKRVVDNEWRLGGRDARYSSDKWDGRNGKGDIAAAGIYYFKIIQSSGEISWGKLAIMP